MHTPVHVGVWPAPSQAGRPIFIEWRDLTFAELRRFKTRNDGKWSKWCDLYETCVIDGPAIDQVPAGIVAWIGSDQLDNSPFSNFGNLCGALDQARQQVRESWLSAARAVVAATFHYSFEDIDGWPPQLFFERLAQAELLTGQPVNPVDPTAPPKKGKTVQKFARQTAEGPDRRPALEVDEHAWQRKPPSR